MPSIIKQAQIDMQTALAAVTDSQGNIIFQLVSNWNNQLQRIQNAQGPAVPTPSAFLEIIPGEACTIGMLVSLYPEFCFRVHILHMQLDAGDELLVEEDFDVFDIRDAVVVSLTGIKPKNCSNIFSGKENLDTSHGNIYHYTIDFLCSFTDTKGSKLDPNSTAFIIRNPPIELDLFIDQAPAPDNLFDTTFDTTFD
jgi:hypothetical protein